jgi:hypothetical protein
VVVVAAAAAVVAAVVAAVEAAAGAAVVVAEDLVAAIRGRRLCLESEVDACSARMIYPIAQTIGNSVTAEKSDKSE